MRRTQQYAARVRRPRPAAEELRQLPEKRSQPDLRERADSPLAAGILRLQRSIGNRAVQRLIVQRQPGKGGGGAEKAKSVPSVVATITLERAGKLEGTCQLAGHEGKVEFSAMGLAPSREPRTEGGRGSGVRVELTQAQDNSTERLYVAYVGGDRITTAQFEFLRRNDSGEVEIVASREFSNGQITGLQASAEDSGGIQMFYCSMEFEAPAAK